MLSGLLLLVLITACSSKTFTYSGETENWSANLKVTQTSDGYEKEEFILQYKGNDVNSVGELTYNVESAGSFGKSAVSLNENGTLRDSIESNPTNAQVTEYTEVEVTVEWNNNSEIIILSNN
jgi:hypothetical protein